MVTLTYVNRYIKCLFNNSLDKNNLGQSLVLAADFDDRSVPNETIS